jgi:hypothetical protein
VYVGTTKMLVRVVDQSLASTSYTASERARSHHVPSDTHEKRAAAGSPTVAVGDRTSLSLSYTVSPLLSGRGDDGRFVGDGPIVIDSVFLSCERCSDARHHIGGSDWAKLRPPWIDPLSLSMRISRTKRR